ncbi:hypothetical protein PRIPAC_94075, partial [Pristionchus pacificus]|uniref:Uncharacterized protein n=1 Tax=Pristionchus pacificus TaxID=54126 RepID=A0A2A6BQF4_PRIPA
VGTRNDAVGTRNDSLREWLERGTMRLWLCLASVIVTVHCAEHLPLERCPDDTVCLIFGHDTCSVRGVRDPAQKGYIWGPDTHCDHEHDGYGLLYSKLDIRPITPFKWKFVATLFRQSYYNGVAGHHATLEKLVFNVGYAEIRIISESEMEFKTDLTGLGRKTNFPNKKSTKFVSYGDWNHYEFEQYLFEIETDQELIDFFGPTVVFHSHDEPKILKDEDFPELLMQKVAKAHRKVERCSCTRSCVVFMQNNPCGARDLSQEFEGSGYVWKNNLGCGRPTYEKLYSQIEFKPITATKWYVSTIVLDEGNGIRDIGFDFGKTAGLTFDGSKAFFTYTREGKQITSDSEMRHEKTFTSEYNKKSYKFKKYSFRMESKGTNITDINNSYVNFKKSGKNMTLNDDAFHEQLKQLKTPEHRKIEPCSEGKACLVFVENDACSCNGDFPQPADSGYVWTRNSTCRRPTYEVLLSRIDFEPISTTKWKAVIITYYAPDKPRHQRDWQIRNIEYSIDINFGNATISAHSANAMSFGWTNREGTVTSSVRPMRHNADEDVITSEDAKSVEEDGRPLTFKRYHFDIEAGGEELHNFFGPEIEFKLKGPNPMALAMNGTEFTKELGQIKKESGLSTLTIVLIVIGVFLLLIIIVAIVIGVCCYCCTKSQRALYNVDARNTYHPVPSNPPIRENPPPSSNSSKSSECESQYITCSANPK